MNIFEKELYQIKLSKEVVKQRQREVLSLSTYIEKTISIDPYDIKGSFKFKSLKNFDIVKRNRCFIDGWFEIFEISPKNTNSFNGIEEWGIVSGGTTTVNLPPDSVIKKFKRELENSLK